MKVLESKYKDVVELNGYYYTVYLTINAETGEVIDSAVCLD